MVKSFEDLEMWQKAHTLLLEMYDVVENISKFDQYVLGTQLLRSSSSIPANIAEGFGRFHYQENIQFLRIARGPLTETKNHLLVAKRRNYITDKQFKSYSEELTTIQKMLNAAVRSTRNQVAKEKDEIKT